MKKTSMTAIVLFMTILLCTSMVFVKAATISTAKLVYYYPDDTTAVLYGSDFQGNSSISIIVTILEDSSYYFSDTIMSSDDGSFVYTYNLPGIVGTYTVTATDGTNTATTTFLDPFNPSQVISSDASGALKTSFLSTDDKYATVTAAGGGGSSTYNVYVYSGSLPSNGATLADYRGGSPTYPLSVTITAAGDTTFSIGSITAAGTYYIVVDSKSVAGVYGTYQSPPGGDVVSAAFTVYAAATKLVFTTGGGQTLAAGAVSSAIVIQRQDASNNPVSTGSPAITVTLTTGSAGGAFYSDSLGTSVITEIGITAGASDTASFYYKDTVAGSATLTGHSGSLTDATTTFTINAGALDHFAISVPASATAGSPFTATVTAYDQFNNVKTNYLGTVHFTSSDLGASVVLPSDYTFVAGDSGAHTFTNGFTLVTAPSQTITVADGLVSKTSDSITVNPGPLHHIVISPDTATIIVGGSQAYTAEAFDQYGNSRGDVTAGTTFGISAGAGGSWSDNVYTSGNAGLWTVTGTYSGKSDTAILTVVPQSKVTTGGYGVMKAPFPLILTPDVSNSPSGSLLFKLSASNPGQFFYNVFYIGWSGPKTITIPFPFVTQGTNPVHVYKGASFDGTTFTPGTEITSDFDISGTPLTLDSYSSKAFGQTASITISLKSGHTGPSSTDVVYIVVHLDYGLKGTTPYQPYLNLENNKDAHKATGSAITTSVVDIPYGQTYTFSATGVTSDTITSKNNFKNDPGVAGFVFDSNGNPISGATIQISGGSGKTAVSATVYTDEDGWYMFNYKYTGKATTFTVQLLSGTYVDAATGKSYSYSGYTQSPTLKSNSFLVASFEVTLSLKT